MQLIGSSLHCGALQRLAPSCWQEGACMLVHAQTVAGSAGEASILHGFVGSSSTEMVHTLLQHTHEPNETKALSTPQSGLRVWARPRLLAAAAPPTHPKAMAPVHMEGGGTCW